MHWHYTEEQGIFKSKGNLGSMRRWNHAICTGGEPTRLPQSGVKDAPGFWHTWFSTLPHGEKVPMTTVTDFGIDFRRIGPTVGERFPDVLLPDQHGQAVDLHQARGTRRALVVFYRSASW